MKPRDILHPHKKKAKHLLSPKSYNDLAAMATASATSSDTRMGGSDDTSVRRSHSWGSSFSVAAANRLALGAVHPHSADAYELINKCGHGATAEVWRARCKSLGNDVAIKIVNLEKAGRSMETIIHEAQLLCRLRHPHILPLLACFTQEETLWMVLPYIQGGSVESAMKYAYPKGLPERVIAPIVLPILKALAYLHKHDIAHRDVKASNVLLDRTNIVLGDFGTAVEMERCLCSGGRAAFGQYLSRTTYVGTPHWMAPEVIEQCEEGHGTKADIYSFGVTLLEMARGKVPFAGMPLEVVAMNKLHHPSPSLPANYEGRTFSTEMQELVAACLEKDPHKRPTADQLLKHRFFKWIKSPKAALEELLNGVPGPVQRLSSLTRRSTENFLAVGDEAASYQADERVSLKTQKSKEAKWATKFDAETAVALLQKMLSSSGGLAQDAKSGDSPDSSLPGSQVSNATYATSGRKLSFSKKKSTAALGAMWPNLPPAALKYCRGILFASASRKGFGLQTMWGHAFILAHLDCGDGKTCWSGPCYLYMSGPTIVGVADNTRESIVLYSGKSFQQRATSGLAFKLSGMQLVDAVEDNLGVEGICNVLKDEDSPCEGVAFRHYSAHKAWKNVAGIVHVDHVANERLYGKPVDPGDILDGKLPPPNSFKQLIDVLNAVEDGKFERHASDGDSDVSSTGLHTGLDRALSVGSAMSMKGGGSPGTTPRDQDTAFSAMSVNFGSPVPPVSSFAESPIFVSSPGRRNREFPGFQEANVSYPRWGGESDDNDGTPPPDYILQGPGYEGQTGNFALIRTDASDASTLSKGDSALDLTYLAEEANKTDSPEDKMSKIVETFRTSPFAATSSQDVRNPIGENRELEIGARTSRPLSPMSTMLKPPKHPRSLSASMNGLKL